MTGSGNARGGAEAGFGAGGGADGVLAATGGADGVNVATGATTGGGTDGKGGGAGADAAGVEAIGGGGAGADAAGAEAIGGGGAEGAVVNGFAGGGGRTLAGACVDEGPDDGNVGPALIGWTTCTGAIAEIDGAAGAGGTTTGGTAEETGPGALLSGRGNDDGGPAVFGALTGGGGKGGVSEEPGGFGAIEAPPRRGYPATGSPFQSFHVSVASGGAGGLPVNSASKTARLTSFPIFAPSTCASTSLSCARSTARPTSSEVPGGTAKAYSRYVSGEASVGFCSRDVRRCTGGRPGVLEPTASVLEAAGGGGVIETFFGGTEAGPPGRGGIDLGPLLSTPSGEEDTGAFGAFTDIGPTELGAGGAEETFAALVLPDAADAADAADAPDAIVSGVSSVARFTTKRVRATGSTARYPSSRSSIENPLIGPSSPRCARAAWSARCQDSASTQIFC